MNKIKKISLIFLIFMLIIYLFKYNHILEYSVINATEIWLTRVFPTLFIMFILNDLIISLDLLSSLNKLINPIFNKIFKVSGNSSNAFLLSIFSGTPSSAFIIKEMLDNKKITITDANKLISFTFFANPLFLFNILSLSFNNTTTIRIILIHYLSNIIIGLLYRNKYEYYSLSYQDNKVNNINVFIKLASAIKKALDNLLMILGTIVFYMIITNLIINIFNFNIIIELLIKGLLEITQALNILNNVNIITIIKEITAISIISFGGLSIHTQVLSIIKNTKINYKNFFLGRILHVLISTITYLFFSFFITS